MALCLYVICMSVGRKSRVISKTNRAGFLALELPLTYPTLCYKEIRISPEIRALPSGTLFQYNKIQYNTKFPKRHVAVASEAKLSTYFFHHGRRSSQRVVNLVRHRCSLSAISPRHIDCANVLSKLNSRERWTLRA